MASLAVEVVADDAGLRGLGEEWDALFDRSVHAPPYLSRAWAGPWWHHFGGRRGSATLAGRSRLHVVTVRDGRRLEALAPWLVTTLGVGPAALRTVVGIGQETADYGGVLLGDAPERTAPVLADHVARLLQGGRTVLDCTRLAPGDPWLEALRERCSSGPTVLAPLLEEAYPRLDLTTMADPVREVARLLKRTDVRRRWRRLDEAGGATFTYHRPGRSTDDLATFLDLHARRWASKAGEPGVPFTPSGAGFLAEAAPALDAAGLLRISLIHAGGRPVAGRFGFEHRGVYHGVQSSWDPEFATYGPGHLLVGKILERGAVEGLQAFDFMRGAADHKAAWTEEERPVSYWAVLPSGRLDPVRRRLMWASLSLRARRRAVVTAP